MEIAGVIIEIGPVTSGASGGREWKRQEFVIEIPGQYASKLCLEINKPETFDFRMGEDVTVSFNVDSRKVGDRWFTNCRSWRIVRNGYQHSGNTAPPQQQQRGSQPPQSNFSEQDDIDKLKY